VSILSQDLRADGRRRKWIISDLHIAIWFPSEL
jgi:hypothetical protein